MGEVAGCYQTSTDPVKDSLYKTEMRPVFNYTSRIFNRNNC